MVVHKLAHSAARTLRANPLEHARNCAQTVAHIAPVHKGTWTGALKPARRCAQMETHKLGHSTARTLRADLLEHARKCAQTVTHIAPVHKGTRTGALRPVRRCAQMGIHKLAHSTARTLRADLLEHARKCAQIVVHKPLVHYTSLGLVELTWARIHGRASQPASYKGWPTSRSSGATELRAASVSQRVTTEVSASLSQLTDSSFTAMRQASTVTRLAVSRPTEPVV